MLFLPAIFRISTMMQVYIKKQKMRYILDKSSDSKQSRMGPIKANISPNAIGEQQNVEQWLP